MPYNTNWQQVANTIARKAQERQNNPNALEFCIQCGEDVPEYTIGTHIDLRLNYVECVGQVCKRCADTARVMHG